MPARKKKATSKIDLSKEIINKMDVQVADAKDFLDYGTTVASSRALPNVYDGLKPVHRYILIAMHDLKLDAKAKTIKSQKVEGDVMGNYSPHAGSYSSIDYLTQNYVFQLPPIHGKGNFSTIDGSPAGAARYTEVRNSIYGDMFMKRVSEKLVPYVPNYDGTKKLPKILPVDFPALLINGNKTGIAVGFTSSIAPHNPVDAIKATIKFFKNPEITLPELVKTLKGPDLPTGGVLIGDVMPYYETGDGKFINQGTIIDDPSDRNSLIITEVPYELGGALDTYIVNVKKAISQNQLPGIKNIDDFSDTDGIKVFVTLDKGVDHEKAKALLFAKTKLQTSYTLSWMALDNKTPKLYGLLSYMKAYYQFQHNLMVKEFKYEKEKATIRLNLVNALLTIPANIKDIIYAAQNTSGRAELEDVLSGKKKLANLTHQFTYNDAQAETIASMRMYQLNRVDAEALQKEKAELLPKIKWSDRYIKEVDLRTELLIARHTKIMEDLIKDGFKSRKTKLLDKSALKEYSYTSEKVVAPITVTIDKYNYIKTTDQLKNSTLTDDMILRYDTTTDDILTIFTNKGNMYQLPTNKLKRLTTRDKSSGDTVYALFTKQGLTPDENVLAYSFRSQLELDSTQAIFVSKNGLAKRVLTKDSSLITKTMRSKVTAYKPRSEDSLYAVYIMDSSTFDNLDIIAIRDNKSKRLALIDIKEQGSMAGAGAQTFKQKDNEPIKGVYIFDNTEAHHIINYNAQDIDLSVQPKLKLTQAFKPLNYNLPDPISETKDETPSEEPTNNVDTDDSEPTD